VEYNYQDADALRRSGKPWYTSGDWRGLSVFLRDGERIFHTYSGVAWSAIPLACLRLIRRYRIRSGPCVTAHRGRQGPAEGPSQQPGTLRALHLT
jgi:hypothetical protein